MAYSKKTQKTSLSDNVNPELIVSKLLEQTFPCMTEEQELKRHSKRILEDKTEAGIKQILLELETQIKLSKRLESYSTKLKPSTLVQDKIEDELVLRQAEAMVSRVLTSSEALRNVQALQNVENLIDFVAPVAETSQSNQEGPQLKSERLDKEAREVREILFFRPENNESIDNSPKTLCSKLNILHGFTSGLLLCKLQKKKVNPSEEVIQVRSGSHGLPYALIKLDSQHMSTAFISYLKHAGIFKDTLNVKSTSNSVQSTSSGSGKSYLQAVKDGSLSMTSSVAQDETKRKTGTISKRRFPLKRSRFHAPLDQYVRSISPPRSCEDHCCSICTFKLSEFGMYDEDEGDDPELVELTGCSHIFHDKCLLEMTKTCSGFIQCPCCKRIYGRKVGTQPDTIRMQHFIDQSIRLPGYEKHGAIVITYHAKPGTQGPEHPNPGKRYSCPGFPRVAYLPDNSKGRKVLSLLKQAFDQKLIFTVGRSTTSGLDNVVTWNDIHHKTHPRRHEHGYPDPSYLDNVIADLAQHGIAAP